MVKAVAERRGMRHYRHRDLEIMVSKLISETEDRRLLELWSTALRLHSNFYV